jgi:hypothetical protein
MITKYNKYITENSNYYNDYQIIYKYIVNYLDNNKVRNLFKLSENFYRDDKLVNLFVKFNHFVILTISLREDFDYTHIISLKSVKDFNDINSVKEYITDYFDNLYITLYKYYTVDKFAISLKINNIPIINVEKYFDFLEKIYLNYKEFKEFKKYPDFLKQLEYEFNTDIILKRYKEEFYKKFKPYFNAKKFDLI